MSNNTVVRGLLVPSLKNKPLDGRQDVPTLADIVNIENPYVNFIFPVAETGKWYKVVSLTDKVIDELVIPNGMVDEYEEFGGGMTDAQKQEYLTKSLAEQVYLKKEDAVNEYLNKTEAEADYLKKKDAEEAYQPKGDYATKEELEDLENRISGGGSDGEGSSFIDAPSDGEVYGRKDGLWKKLEDAPKDGKAYARINGVWSPIESGNALDPLLPVLSLSINSTRDEDVTIQGVSALVTFADKEFVLGDGGKINVPYGLDVTVTFPNVDGYTSPESVLFENVQGDINAEGTYIYLKESLYVYVSADDGTSVDGQIVTIKRGVKYQLIPNGVYIEDLNGVLYKGEEWDVENTYNSIVLINDELKVRTIPIYRNDSVYHTTGALTPQLKEDALNDFNGEYNTSMSPGRTPFSTSIGYVWPNGDNGAYIPALGEMSVWYEYWDEYLSILKILGISIGSNIISSTPSENVYNSSYYYSWGINLTTGGIFKDIAFGGYLNFRKVAEDELKVYSKESQEVLGGKASFDVLIGDGVTVSIDAKDGYSKPDDVSFVIEDGGKNVSFVYNKLIIDTIYINNLSADTSAIISGEMNGPAVQAIWGGVNRYLGKIVTNDEGTNELVLLDIDQNDNRYYTDGSLIDLEGLGTSAYFFTKIPSMSYKITQMSDNIYKVEISYKYKPYGDGWKHFEELIVQTFNYTSSTYPVYYTQTAFNLTTDNAVDGLERVDFIDYSNIILLLYARYGVYNFDDIEEFDVGIFTDSSGNYLTGFSVSNGARDAKYKSDVDINYIYNILGIENFVMCVYSKTSNDFITSQFYNKEGNHEIIFNGTDLSASIDTDRYSGTIETNNLKGDVSSQYIKSLAINDFFLALGVDYGGTSDTYYKEPVSVNTVTSTMMKTFGGLCRGNVIDASANSTVRNNRRKFINPYRIESDREAFNELTNIWK